MQLFNAHIECLPSLCTARMKLKLAVLFSLDKRRLSARPVMH